MNDQSVSSMQDRYYEERQLVLSRKMSNLLQNVASEIGVTVNTCVQAAWALVISDFSRGADDVVFGVLRSGRNATEKTFVNSVGLFINTVPLRVRINREHTLRQLLTSIRKSDVAIRPHEHTALSDIKAVSEISSGNALFESVVVFNAKRFDRLKQLPSGMTYFHFEWIEQTNFPVTLFAYSERELEFNIVWDPKRLDEQFAVSMLMRLNTALEVIVEAAQTPLIDVMLQSKQEQNWVAKYADHPIPFDDASCVHHFFERQCKQIPEQVALVHDGVELTYSQLNLRANAVADELHSLGVKPDMLIGLYMDRCIDMVVGLFAILKSGGAYVPLDPDFPSWRVTMMLEDCSAKVVLTNAKLLTSLPPHHAKVLCIDDIQTNADTPFQAPQSGVTSANLAYVIFTSGSTGRPKGVMVEHRNVANFFTGMDERIGPEPGVWLAVTSISFDISVLELFWTLGRGFKVVLQEKLTKIAHSSSAIKLPAKAANRMDFGLFYFSADAGGCKEDRYKLLIEGAKFADTHGFNAVWTPERHFHQFGGLYPNPAVTSAALATITNHVQLRAGSCVLPLHHPLRVAEEWSLVDNLSGGRVGLSFASGWHANDFGLLPENYAERKQIMFAGIETIKALWRGDSIPVNNGRGEPIKVKVFPSPIQVEPPIWITAAGNIETFEAAGEFGANLLTHLLGQSISELAEKIATYRAAWKAANHKGEGKVTVMLHTFVGEDRDAVREIVRKPFTDYLRTATDLVKKTGWYFPAFKGSERQENKDGNSGSELHEPTVEETEALLNHAFERYFRTSGLFGSPKCCLKIVHELKQVGVSEIACLIDFGVPTEQVLANLPYLNRLREISLQESELASASRKDSSILAQIERYGVTHLQCTPSLAQMILRLPEADRVIRKLQTFIIGGEALPEALARQITKLLPKGSQLLNMYGPTETTVWSSVAAITENSAVTIGTPIANTTLRLLDEREKPAPIGAPGELHIGGAGVARGYLNSPELTSERFVTHIDDTKQRFYKTGDIARYLPDGRLQFLGRLDHQVKLHGHRIELGEIERILIRHPLVEQTIVLIPEGRVENRQLVAYLRINEKRSADESVSFSRVERWREIWQQTYKRCNPGNVSDFMHASFDFFGWNSSYTGQPIPSEEMKEWVEQTTANIVSLNPTRVLEIGCGNGLLLYRLAPHCELYSGIDFDAEIIQSVKHTCKNLGLTQVELFHSAANDLKCVADESYDIVVINSVVQYFPDARYLEKVLVLAERKLQSGGALFVGDVRNLDSLNAFHLSVELAQSPADMSIVELMQRVELRGNRESELVVSPHYFSAFAKKHGFPRLSIALKRGAFRNEMNCFRYDVLLRKENGKSAECVEILKVDGHRISDIEELQSVVKSCEAAVCVSNLLNARLVEDVRVCNQLEIDNSGDIARLHEQLDSKSKSALEPNHVYELSNNYDVSLTFSADDAARFDATLIPKSVLCSRFIEYPVELFPQIPSLESYVNTPADVVDHADIKTALRTFLAHKLPEYMIPNTFVFLGVFPLNANGKVDLKALPVPNIITGTVHSAKPFTPPANDLEQSIAQIWKRVLNINSIDIEANFMILGANSLLMMQANTLLQQQVEPSLSIIDLFNNPTIASLAAHIDGKNKAKLNK